jgi:hypothetical protein
MRHKLAVLVFFSLPSLLPGRQAPARGDPREHAANATEKSALGIGGKPNIAVSGRTISGSPNRNGNDGITNELFQRSASRAPDVSTRTSPTTRRISTPRTSSPARRRSRTSPTSSAFSRRRSRRPIRREVRRRSRAGAAILSALAARCAISPRCALRPFRPSSLCATARPTCIRTCWCTTWAWGRRREPGRCRPARVPHRAAAGSGPAHLLPARRADFRPEGRDFLRSP